ncbi:hypothetical protein JCM10213_007131 [Rhodosporidiobolus nylandii]
MSPPAAFDASAHPPIFELHPDEDQQEEAKEQLPDEDGKQDGAEAQDDAFAAKLDALNRKARRKLEKWYKKHVKKGALDEEELLGIWTKVQNTLEAKMPNKWEVNWDLPRGCRLQKKGNWASRSMRPDLLSPSSVNSELSWLGILCWRLMPRGDDVYHAFQTILTMKDPLSFRLQFDILAAGQAEMRSSKSGGVYLLQATDGRYYVGVTTCFYARRSTHTSGAVNHLFRELEEAGDDRSRWKSFIIFLADDDDPSTLLYGMETLVNLLGEATNPVFGLNVNQLDICCWQALATAKDVQRIWLSVGKALKKDPSLHVYSPDSPSPDVGAFWRQVNCAPLSPFTVYEIIKGAARSTLGNSLEAAYPLRKRAFVATPAALLTGSAKTGADERSATAPLYSGWSLVPDGAGGVRQKAPQYVAGLKKKERAESKQANEAALAVEQEFEEAEKDTLAGKLRAAAVEGKGKKRVGADFEEVGADGSGASSSAAEPTKKKKKKGRKVVIA